MRRSLHGRLALPVAFTAIIGCFALSACATAPAPQRSMVSPSRDFLRAADVTPSYQSYDALEFLRLVRPEFLRNRARSNRLTAPTEPVVYVNGLRLADLSMLRHIAARSIVEVQYVRGIAAVVRYGADHESGVILMKASFRN